MTVSRPLILGYTMTLDDLVDGSRLLQRSFRRFATVLGAGIGVAGVILALTSGGWLSVAMIGYGLLECGARLGATPRASAAEAASSSVGRRGVRRRSIGPWQVVGTSG
jgi:hypothetical protein